MNRQSNSKDSILAVTLLLLILFLYTRNFYLVYASLLLIVLSLLSGKVAHVVHTAWMKVTHILGTISSTLLLTAIFYLALFPWSMILKLLGKKTLLLDSNVSSTFINRNKLFTKDGFQNPY